jgi:energy-coupling factor transport system ATP-binding protein
MDGGRIVLSGTPSEIFADAEALRDLRLDVPAMKQLADRLQAQGIPVSGDVLQVEDMVREVKRLAAAI